MNIGSGFRTCCIPADLNQRLEAGYRRIFTSLGVMFSGMIFASLWQWVSGSQAKSLVESPAFLNAMMLGGLSAFIISLLYTIFVVPICYDIQKLFLRHRS